MIMNNDFDVKLLKSISSLLLNFIRIVIKDQLRVNGEWTIGIGSEYREHSNLDSVISMNHSISLLLIDKPNNEGDFFILFRLQGELSKILRNNDSPDIVQVIINGSGYDDYVVFEDEEQLKLIKSCNIFSPLSTNEQLKIIQNQLEKKLMFTLIKD